LATPQHPARTASGQIESRFSKGESERQRLSLALRRFLSGKAFGMRLSLWLARHRKAKGRIAESVPVLQFLR